MQTRSISTAAMLAVAFALATATFTASAQDAPAAQQHRMGQHPAVLVKAMRPAIDPNTFIVGHPAGLVFLGTPLPAEAAPMVAATTQAESQSNVHARAGAGASAN